jgi:anti-sigma B factor antagonist
MTVDVVETKSGTKTILEAKGRLDTMTSGEFEKRVAALIAAGSRQLVFDFSRLTFLSSAGLRAILFAAKAISAKRGKLTLGVPAGPVRETLAMAGVIPLLAVFHSQAEATRACELPEVPAPGV